MDDSKFKLKVVTVIISVVALVLSISNAVEGFLLFDIAWIAVFLCGVPIVLTAGKNLILHHNIKAGLLVSIALIASLFMKEYFAAGEVALIMQIGDIIEGLTAGKARESLNKLIDMTPRKARRLVDGREESISVENIRIGDVLSVIAGETVPLDGIIIEGTTSIDQSIMTGESIPVDKGVGDFVSSGTINQYGTFLMKVEKTNEDSSLQRMIKLVKEAEEQKAPVVSIADRWATYLVAIALGCAGIIWGLTGEFIRAVTVLVVFCPCSFVLATPTAILAGVGNAAKHGIIIKSGNSLEKLSKIEYVAFDKTGTLTYGKPKVERIESLSENYIDEDLLKIAASLEAKSEHPLGKAIRNAYEGALYPIENFRVLSGRGVSGKLKEKEVIIGKEDLIRKIGIPFGKRKRIEGWLSKGRTLVYIAINRKVVGYIVLSDFLREKAYPTVERMKKIGLTPILLTGDNQYVATQIANKLKIEEVHSDLLPEEKGSIIQTYVEEGKKISMIGDGVNDALALSRASGGIAMGGIGSDIAIESADAILVSDEIERLPYLFLLVKKVMKKVKINIVISILINLTAVVLSGLAILNPVTGALWHNFGSVFVVVNAAFILKLKDR